MYILYTFLAFNFVSYNFVNFHYNIAVVLSQNIFVRRNCRAVTAIFPPVIENQISNSDRPITIPLILRYLHYNEIILMLTVYKKRTLSKDI